VVASVINAPVVKVGRANPQPRRTVYTLRKTGSSWLIETIR
jgi:hypothetical protein